MSVACAVRWNARTLRGLSCPYHVLDTRSNFHTRILFPVSVSFLTAASRHFKRRLPSWDRKPKCSAIPHPIVRCKTAGFELPNSPHTKKYVLFLPLWVSCCLRSAAFSMLYGKLTASKGYCFTGQRYLLQWCWHLTYFCSTNVECFAGTEDSKLPARTPCRRLSWHFCNSCIKASLAPRLLSFISEQNRFQVVKSGPFVP